MGECTLCVLACVLHRHTGLMDRGTPVITVTLTYVNSGVRDSASTRLVYSDPFLIEPRHVTDMFTCQGRFCTRPCKGKLAG